MIFIIKCACLPAQTSACLPACLPASQLARFAHSLPACLPKYYFEHLPACPNTILMVVSGGAIV